MVRRLLDTFNRVNLLTSASIRSIRSSGLKNWILRCLVEAKALAIQALQIQQAPPEQFPPESKQAQRPGLPGFQIAKNPPIVSSLAGSSVKSEEQNALQELQAITELRKPV
jgi:hypothetical protein